LTLIDYGLGNLYASGERLTTSCGSHCYAAPEMMNSKSYDPEKTEVWALGVTLYAMLSGKLPFEEELPSKLLKQMLSNDYE
jgi:serine/threonine protein kinase